MRYNVAMFTALRRVAKSGFINFWRNGSVSVASVLVMAVTLFSIGILLFTGAVLQSSLDAVKSKVDISVYFITSATEQQVLAVKTNLQALSEVASVTYISADQALSDFETRHQGDQLTLNALSELGGNPLGAELNVTAKDPSQYAAIAQYLSSSDGQSGSSIIDQINYYQNATAIERLSAIISTARLLGLLVIILFAIISALIIFNTIGLAIYNAREEISVMRLVGASNSYIRGPFVIEGLMYGFCAAIVALVLLYPLAYWLGPYTVSFFSGLNLFSYYMQNFGQFFLILCATGVGLGGISSFIAVRRYLKV